MTKILIDEAVVRLSIYAAAMVVDIEKLEDWQLELHEKATADLSEAMRQALADAALDKMADNARELGLSYEQPAQAQDDHFAGGGKPMVEQPAQQEPLTDEAKAVIDAARAAMDASTEADDGNGSITISSELAASLSLCLDEYARATEAAHPTTSGEATTKKENT